MDPISKGIEIFKSLADSFEDEIRDLSILKKFFEELIKRTEGFVIVDFLNTENWDNIEGFNIEENFLSLYWHDFRNINETEEDMEPMRMAFPADLYALLMHFQSLKIFRTEKYPLFLLRGFAISEKEIKKKLAKDTIEFKMYPDNHFFRRTCARKTNQNKIELYDVLNTPIYSLLILPKNSILTSFHSKHFLYDFNISESLKKLIAVRAEIEKMKNDDFDKICEKANTVRRVLENVLKIECCFWHEQLTIKKSYSQLLLGDLAGILKELHDETKKMILNKSVQLANELSHDSGLPIDKNKAELLCLLSISYSELLRMTMRSESNRFNL